MAQRLAAVDIGTNSVRLLVADVAGADVALADVTGADPNLALAPIERRMRITRLGQGVDATHSLNPTAVDRTLTVLREYRAVVDALGVERVRVTATSAARDADNRDTFFDQVNDALGVTPELLSGDEEARLSFAGATADLEAPAPYLVIDIGGGSTEFVLGTKEPEQLVSIDVGCVRITEQFLHSDPPTPEELSAAVSVVRDHVADVEQSLPGLRDAATLVGLAGTITTIAAIEQGLHVYDRDRIHHFLLTRAAAEDVFRTLALEPQAERRHNPGLDPDRVDVIVGGAIVLVAILRTLEIPEVLVSEADILDGLVRSLAA